MIQTQSQKICNVIDKPWFFNKKPSPRKLTATPDDHHNQAAIIIAKCKKLLNLMQEKDARETLHKIIEQTDAVLRLAAELEGKHEAKRSDLLLVQCQKLQQNALHLPQEFPTEKNLNAVNAKIAAACFYLLVLSLCITLGATFGAWYFGFLTAGYFVNTLVGALSAVGVPASCLGLVSYGLYKAGTASQEDYTTLPDDIANLCVAVVKEYDLEIEPEAPSM